MQILLKKIRKKELNKLKIIRSTMDKEIQNNKEATNWANHRKSKT